MSQSKSLSRFLPAIAAIAVTGSLFLLAQPPTISEEEASSLAKRFAFEKHPLPEPVGLTPKKVRKVHPSLSHLAGAVSFVGASVAVEDLTGDGSPNDVVLVDPRYDSVLVAPAPSTGDRFKPFVLAPRSLPYDPSRMAPMGVLMGDWSGNGKLDVLVYYWGRSPVIFLQEGTYAFEEKTDLTRDSFVERELVSPPETWNTSAATQADLNADGRMDLLIANYFPDGREVLNPNGSGVAELPHSLCRAYNGGRNRVFLGVNGKSGSVPTALFHEVEAGFDEQVAHGWTFGIGVLDVNKDDKPDIYFVQDWGPDRLLLNQSAKSKLKFKRLVGRRGIATPRSLSLGRDSFNGMGIDIADFDRDGHLDISVNNICVNRRLLESNFLWRNTGEIDVVEDGIAPFENVAEQLGVSRSGWAWGVRMIDLDNDRVCEIIHGAGFLKGNTDRWPEMHEWALMNDELTITPRSWHRMELGDDISGSDHNPFYVRAADGRYYDVAKQIGLDTPMCTRGIAVADSDGDGKLDFFTANNWEKSYLFLNKSKSAGRFLGLRLRLEVAPQKPAKTRVLAGRPRLKAATRAAIGAEAVLFFEDGKKVIAQVDGGTGHSGRRSHSIHFGLGDVSADQVFKVELRWRGIDGRMRNETLHLKPGWHSVVLKHDVP